MELAPDITADDLKVFLEEVDEQLQLLDEDIIRLEKEDDNGALLQEIFRAAHTLKGSSAMVGHSRMSELAHAMESVLDRVRKGALSPDSGVIDALLHSLDGLRVLKEELTSSGEGEYDISTMVAELEASMVGESSSAGSQRLEEKGGSLVLDEDGKERLNTAVSAGQHAFEVHVDLEKDSPWTAVRCFQILTDLSRVGEVIQSTPTMEEIEEEKVGSTLELVVSSLQSEEHLVDAVQSIPEIQGVTVGDYHAQETRQMKVQAGSPARRSSLGEGQTSQARQYQTVRIDVDRLDGIMNMIGELVIATSRIVQIGKSLELKYREEDMVHELSRSSSQTAKVVNELQEDIMRVRMLPVGTVFSGFPRMIRDLAQKSKKKVDFIMEGQETGIDRTVIEHIRDPLVHLLRNAVDHGIETSKRRTRLGKPDTATIWLSACHEESHVVITVEDDGGGIDANLVRESAVRKGFISAEEASRLSDEEAVDLIFGSGLSTKEQATDVSGRGVGLDIVRKNIGALNGYVTVETKVGAGTKFTLRLPLTLATLDSLLITCGNALYAIPVVNVWETVRITPKDIHRVGDREVIRLRGSVLLLLRLGEFFGLGMGEQGSEGGLMNIVVVRAGDKQVGIAVETLVGKQEIVVKSLDDNLGKVVGIAGASILGDGQVALIIDVPSLIKSVVQGARS